MELKIRCIERRNRRIVIFRMVEEATVAVVVPASALVLALVFWWARWWAMESVASGVVAYIQLTDSEAIQWEWEEVMSRYAVKVLDRNFFVSMKAVVSLLKYSTWKWFYRFSKLRLPKLKFGGNTNGTDETQMELSPNVIQWIVCTQEILCPLPLWVEWLCQSKIGCPSGLNPKLYNRLWLSPRRSICADWMFVITTSLSFCFFSIWNRMKDS